MRNVVDCIWNVMAHMQKPDFVFQVHLNWWRRQFGWLLAAEVCTSAVVMLDTPCSEVVWRVLATHSIRQFPLHFPSLHHHVPSHFNWTLPHSECVAVLAAAGRGQLKCDGTHAETSFRLSVKRMSQFKSAGVVRSVDYWQLRCAHQR